MNIIEYLKKNKADIDLSVPIELKDVIDDRGIYCKDYNDLIKELSLIGYEHIVNARYIYSEQINDCNVIFYMKNTEDYSSFDLMQLLEKLQGDMLN